MAAALEFLARGRLSWEGSFPERGGQKSRLFMKWTLTRAISPKKHPGRIFSYRQIFYR